MDSTKHAHDCVCPVCQGVRFVVDLPATEYNSTIEVCEEQIESLKQANAALRAEVETERMRLAACGVAALSNTDKSAKEQRINGDSPYWSASYGDVCDAVDREMKLRAEVDSLKQHIERLVTEKDGCAKNWYDCRADLAAAVEVLRKLYNKFPKIDADYSGCGRCYGCGAVQYCGDGKGADQCKPDCLFIEARALLARLEVKP